VGRYKKPEHIKLLSGTLEKRDKHTGVKVTIPDGMPLPPDHMSDEAKQAWEYFAGQLHEMGILTSADALMIEIMCITYVRMKQNQRILDMRGSSTYIHLGRVTVYPEVAIVADCAKLLNNMMQKCGMSPLDRTRLAMPQRDESSNPFEDL
jgi:P27 family predicted phage terminase small subunit